MWQIGFMNVHSKIEMVGICPKMFQHVGNMYLEKMDEYKILVKP